MARKARPVPDGKPHRGDLLVCLAVATDVFGDAVFITAWHGFLARASHWL